MRVTHHDSRLAERGGDEAVVGGELQRGEDLVRVRVRVRGRGRDRVRDRVRVRVRVRVPNRNQTLTLTTFGCQTHETGLFNSQVADGISGLSRSRAYGATLFDALREKTGAPDVFSICLDEEVGALVLGANPNPNLNPNPNPDQARHARVALLPLDWYVSVSPTPNPNPNPNPSPSTNPSP